MGKYRLRSTIAHRHYCNTDVTVTVKTRKVVDDAGEILKKEFRQRELLSISEVELLTNELSSELKRLYDLIAPETEKKVNDRKRVPWFDHSAKQQKNVVRNIEKNWMIIPRTTSMVSI